MQAGSYVVCIDDSNWDIMAHVRLSSLPKKGDIYIIRRIIPNFDKHDTEDGLALEGIFGNWMIFEAIYNKWVFEEFHFRKSRFREIEGQLLTELVSKKDEEFVD